MTGSDSPKKRASGKRTRTVREPSQMETTTEQAVERLHGKVDELVNPLAQRHAERLHCRVGCAACCVDDLTVFEVEAHVIQRHYPDLLASGKPHSAGACAFLDETGGCRVYAHRPYVCRTQGLPLRWLEEGEDDTPLEYRDICPLNEDGPPVESLPPDACWTIGPVETVLSELQYRQDNGQGRRVALRSLFCSHAD